MSSGLSRRLFTTGGASALALSAALAPGLAEACHLTKTCWKKRLKNNNKSKNSNKSSNSNKSNNSGKSSSSSSSSGGYSRGRIVVRNYGELSRAVRSASSGKTIELSNGTYSGSRLDVSKSGIRIVARSRLRAKLRCELRLRGSNITLEGVSMRGRGIITFGSNNRITRCRIESAGVAVNILGGSGVTVDRCEFVNWTFRGIASRPNKGVRRPLIEKNYFTNSRRTGGAGIGIGTSRHDNMISVGARVQYNLFENDRSHDETIMVKSSNNTVRGNTLYRSNFIYNRHGKRNKYLSNWIENSKGMFLNDQGSEATRNMIRNCVQGLQVAAGNIEPSQANRQDGKYPRAVDIVLAGNNANRAAIGIKYNGSFRLPAKNVRVEGHSGRVYYRFAQGTKVRGGASRSASSPSRLRRGQVGVNA